jgi:hypothetical protein
MMKALGIAAAAAVAFAPVVATTSGVAQAAPCAGDGSNPSACQDCLKYVAIYGIPTPRSCYEGAPPRPAQASPSMPPLPVLPPEPSLPSMTPVHTPQVVPPSPSPPSTSAVHGPTINSLPPGAPRNVSVVTPPKGLDASPQAVAAAKAAPATRVNPAVQQMLQVVDFNHQVQDAVSAHGGNVEVVKADNKALPRPRHWDYVDYDAYHRPSLYNPLNQAMTFRFFYSGAYREAYVPAGGRIVLDAAKGGLYPFTAVGDSYVAAGSFYGGAWIPPPDGWNGPPPPDYTPPAPPQVYQDVLVDVPAEDQVVQVGHVALVGHDDSQPAGSQDTFLLDDSTLAWGQINDSTNSSQIRVTKTQSLPGVGATDNGSLLIALAAYKEPVPSKPWWPSVLGYGGLAIAVGFVAWMISRRSEAEFSPAGEADRPAEFHNSQRE